MKKQLSGMTEIGVSRRSALGAMGLGLAGLGLAGAGTGVRRATLAQPVRGVGADDVADPGAMQGAGFYRTRVGEAEVFVVSDGSFSLGDPSQILAVNATPEEIDVALKDAFLARDEVTGQVNTLLIRTREAVVLVDTGTGGAFGASNGKMTGNLARIGVTPADVDAVVLTHAHGDHHGGLLAGPTAAAFTKARFFVSKVEQEFWRGPTPDFARSVLPKPSQDQMIQGANRALDAIKDRTDLIADNDQIAPGIHAVLLGGHTPGHLGIRVSSGNQELLYVSDLIHHVAFGMRNPEWHVAFDVDPTEGSRVRRAMLERLASDGAQISGAHLPFPAVGHVAREGRAFRFAPVYWSW
jgi:glyoxylase-like metal-dependent hydrolase (beta-lactamase superfamily II)